MMRILIGFFILTSVFWYLSLKAQVGQPSEPKYAWLICADYKTDEILAVGGAADGFMNIRHPLVRPQVFYSTNNGKYIELQVISFDTLPGEHRLKVIFPGQKQKVYTLDWVGFNSCGMGIDCTNPDGTKQHFVAVGTEKSLNPVPTSQYGEHIHTHKSNEDYFYIFDEGQTGERLTFFNIDGNIHFLYRGKQKNKYIELIINKYESARAVYTVHFPGNTAMKYLLKYESFNTPGGLHYKVTSPDGSTQMFNMNMAETMQNQTESKSVAGYYNALTRGVR